MDGEDGVCGVDEVNGRWLAECALVPIVRAARIGATLRILHVGCFSKQSFLTLLAELLSLVRRGSAAPPGAVAAAMGGELPALLSDDALRRMHVVATTDAVPGDAVVEILVNYARYAGSGSLEEYWIKLIERLQTRRGNARRASPHRILCVVPLFYGSRSAPRWELPYSAREAVGAGVAVSHAARTACKHSW